ncbi:MAG: fucose isomerase, partial [Anaerolineae bacterium]|nr:fucose isomerase [Anaerolineae bacterium]
MVTYILPQFEVPQPLNDNEAVLIASGDLRLAANQTCWPAQQEMEKHIIEAFAAKGITVIRAHGYDSAEGHGFISSQRMGMDIFRGIHPDARLIVAEAVWQYSHHVLAGLRDHRGPILTVANWSGEWPGLVGLLNLNGSLTKMGVKYSTIWSENFDDDFFLKGIQQWIDTGTIKHDFSHVKLLEDIVLPSAEAELGRALAQQL